MNPLNENEYVELFGTGTNVQYKAEATSVPKNISGIFLKKIK